MNHAKLSSDTPAAVAHERQTVAVRAPDGSHPYEAHDDERILYAGLRSGLDLPYECATGTCGTCKARVIEGKVEVLWPEAPGFEGLKPDRGDILMCQCVAKGPVTVEVPRSVQDDSASRYVPSWFEGELTDVRTLAPDVTALDVVLDHPLDFEAGQFMAVEVPSIPGTRGYSMLHFTPAARRLGFVVRKKPGGAVSEWLFSADRTGERVRLFGPLGRATFDPGLDRDLLCIAGGTGIAGILSILDHACQTSYPDKHRCDVFFGVRTPGDAFCLDELSGLRRRFPESLHVTVAFSDSAAGEAVKRRFPDLEFTEGFVHDAAAARMKDRLENILAYVAGPPPAVNAAIRFLIMSRVGPGDIRYDKFS